MSPTPQLFRADSLSNSHLSSAHSSSTSMFSPNNGSKFSASQIQSPCPEQQDKLNSARRENPLVRQFSNPHVPQAIQMFKPKVNPFDAAVIQNNFPANEPYPQINYKESLYEKILLNKDLETDLFDNVSDEEEDTNGGESEDSIEENGLSFKFN